MTGRFFEFRFIYDDAGYATDAEDETEAWNEAKEECARIYRQRHSNANRVEICEELQLKKVKIYELQELLDELEEAREDDEED